MEKILQAYIAETGGIDASVVAETKKYGTVYEIQYGKKMGNGMCEPTGLPVLVYIKDGKVEMIDPMEGLELLAGLDK